MNGYALAFLLGVWFLGVMERVYSILFEDQLKGHNLFDQTLYVTFWPIFFFAYTLRKK